ncbi:MAG: hypothetical protein ACFFCW_32765, partial [Candidatus Hodarchaeota archaeon]
MKISTESVNRSLIQNPYKFLEYFVEDDHMNFAGRDREIREVVTGIMRGRTFVLYGRSGLGKTSLLRAGVFPELLKRKHHPIYIRTLIKPLTDLCEAIATELGKPPTSLPDGLHNLLMAFPKEETVVLVLDQFEEFFIRFREKQDEQDHFIQTVGNILQDNSLTVRVVFSLREDYLAQMDDFQGYLPDLFDNEYRLLPLSAYGTRRAVAQPLINTGIKYEQRLVASIVDQLSYQKFNPPLLQVICTEVYREASKREQENLELRFEDLERVGGLEGIFRRYLNSFVLEVPKKNHLIARTILDALITQENTKQAVTLDFFQQAGFRASEDEIRDILKLLVAHGLVRSDERGIETWYELLHECLVPMILEWLNLDQEFFNFRFARDLIENCVRGEVFRNNHDVLLNLGQIKGVVGPYKDRLHLNKIETEFMAWSVIYRCSPAADLSEHVKFWCDKFGTEESFNLLLMLFKNEDETAKLGAANAAPLLPGRNGRLAEECLHLALSDKSEKVRRAAGKSFALLASDNKQLEVLKDSFRKSETRRYALEVLADMHLAGRSITSFK